MNAHLQSIVNAPQARNHSHYKFGVNFRNKLYLILPCCLNECENAEKSSVVRKYSLKRDKFL